MNFYMGWGNDCYFHVFYYNDVFPVTITRKRIPQLPIIGKVHQQNIEKVVSASGYIQGERGGGV